MTAMFDLTGRTAMVTGASSGLGEHFAGVLAAAGARVVLAARRRERLEARAASIRESGGDALCVDLDVTRGDSIADCFGALDRQGIGVDVLVNNAGISRESFLTKTSEDDWDAVIDTNLKGVFLVAQAVASRLIDGGRPGSIVNIASIIAFRSSKTLGSYGAAKAGVVHLTQAMALEWARAGIRVNAIAPGYFKTEINEHFMATPAGQALIGLVPQKRLGAFDDLSAPLLLLASDAGAYMTGSCITVDGGLLLAGLG